MGASSGIQAGEQASAEALLDAFKTIDGSGRAKHSAVLDYWLAIRGSKELPPLRDLDPLEISDAGPTSVLLELVGGGEDATIRYLGDALKTGADAEQIAQAPRSSVLGCIAKKLSIVAISRNFLAFEEEFSNGEARTRCWITLYPLSSAGAWVDYVYAFVTLDAGAQQAEAGEEPANDLDVLELVAAEERPVEIEESVQETEEPVDEVEQVQAAEDAPSAEADQPSDELVAPEPAPAAGKKAGFSFDGLAAAGGFYGTQAVKVKTKATTAIPISAKDEAPQPADEPVAIEPQEELAAAAEEDPLPTHEEQDFANDPVDPPVAEEPAPVAAVVEEPVPPAPVSEEFQPSSASEGTLQSKLEDVRAKADEARQAKLRANAALYEGLSAAYDFALDAESSPEEYLKMCEEKGLKIQLRSPMKPVAKLAFDGMCDDSTIAQLEAVLAWALKHDLPKGSLADRIDEEGGLAPILSGQAKAA